MNRTRFSDRQLADIVMELNGEVEPVGETNVDNMRFGNLLRLLNAVDILLDEISFVLLCAERYEYSMKRSGQTALTWMEEKRDWLIALLGEIQHE